MKGQLNSTLVAVARGRSLCRSVSDKPVKPEHLNLSLRTSRTSSRLVMGQYSAHPPPPAESDGGGEGEGEGEGEEFCPSLRGRPDSVMDSRVSTAA